MNLHLVGGFLGSGKTTAIIQAARSLMARGMRVGVITNDQGKYLVDTAFYRFSEIPALEVTGGCFCCGYEDLNARLGELIAASAPQVIFAESVGSCADLVATVVKPLLALDEGKYQPASFTVFADARLLLRRLRGDEMPFSEDVTYIFDKQIEEAGLLVANKADLLPFDHIAEIQARIKDKFGALPYILQSSLTPEGVWSWVSLIQAHKAPVPQRSLEIDYRRYAQGEASLAWVDQKITLAFEAGKGKSVLENALKHISQALAGRNAAVGHIKIIIGSAENQVKVSLPTLEETGWEQRIPEIPGKEVALLLNARAELPVEELKALLLQAFEQPGVTARLNEGEAFHPKEPKPTYRL